MSRATLAMVVSPIVTGPLFPTWDGALWVGEIDRADVQPRATATSSRSTVPRGTGVPGCSSATTVSPSGSSRPR